jgi:plasmid stabilization system protein ParE
MKSVLLSAAKNDVREAAKWYNEQQTGLGRRFTADVRKRITSIKQNLYAYSIKYGQVRTAVLDNFPYMVHFSIENDRTILVSAVLHTSRNPKIWTERNESAI